MLNREGISCCGDQEDSLGKLTFLLALEGWISCIKAKMAVCRGAIWVKVSGWGQW